MRPLEILLMVVDSLAFIRWLMPRFRPMRWTGYIAPLALLAALTQVFIEGYRWQMIPAYALTAIFFMLWMLGFALPRGMHISRVFNFLAAGAGMLALVVSATLPTIMPVFHFPKPTGPYTIGTLTYHWIDASRPELFTIDPNVHRELMAQIWYPAKAKPASPRAPYIQDADAVTPALGQLLHLPGFVFSYLKYVTTNAVAAVPIADNQSSYPVLIYLTGVDGFRSVNTFQVENLVSHGYIVVGLDQPGISAAVRFPDGRQIPGWSRDQIQPLINQSVKPQSKAPTIDGKPLPDGIIPYFAQDASFALDQLARINQSDPDHILTGHLDLSHTGTFGVSLGGMDAAEACLKDPRFKACLIMNVWMPEDVVKSGLKQPAMFITRDAATMQREGWTESDIALTIDTMRAVYQNLPGDGYYVQIPGMFHVNFTDLPYWSPFMSQLGMTGPINPQRGFDIVNAYTLAFFNKELKDLPAPILNGPSSQFPDANIEVLRH